MTLVYAKNHIEIFENNIITIIRYWIGNEEVLNLLRRYEIDIKFFVKEFALGIIRYFLKIFENITFIGDCPVIDKLVVYLKNEGTSTKDLFILCNGLKNSFEKTSFELNIANKQLFEEFDYVYTKNFTSILDKYNNSFSQIKRKLDKTSDIIDRYVITSRVSAKGKILYASEAFSNISGFSKEELTGKYNNILKHIDMPKKFFAEFYNLIKEKSSFSGEIKCLKKNGNFYWVDVLISPHYDNNNEFMYFDLLSHNITSRKKLQEQKKILVEQSKLAVMGEMISMIAHQWRQPLQAVSIMSQKILINKALEGEVSEEFLEETINNINTQLDYMSKTIDDFRDFFLPNKVKEKTSIEFIINKALEFVSYLIKNDSIDISIEKSTDTQVELFVNEIVQVIINIIKNARDVLEERNIENKQIKIRYFQEENFLVIEIEDNAGGINDDVIEKIFNPYFSTKDNKNGTGLGLYMSKTIIEKHSSGILDVQNTKNGAMFIIKLPINNV